MFQSNALTRWLLTLTMPAFHGRDFPGISHASMLDVSQGGLGHPRGEPRAPLAGQESEDAGKENWAEAGFCLAKLTFDNEQF